MRLHLNGDWRDIDAPPLTRLLDVLRLSLGQTGTKEGCGEGECGSCTILLDGDPVNACLVPIGQCDGRRVTTVEGLGVASHLTPLQDAFITDGGAQCGICTPGMLIAAEALLTRNDSPSDHEIHDAIAGNICRCTGYQRIVASIETAAASHRAERAAREESAPRPLPEPNPELL